MKQITRTEIRDAVSAYCAGDPRPCRSLRWRAFWWGFLHPFGSVRNMWSDE